MKPMLKWIKRSQEAASFAFLDRVSQINSYKLAEYLMTRFGITNSPVVMSTSTVVAGPKSTPGTDKENSAAILLVDLTVTANCFLCDGNSDAPVARSDGTKRVTPTSRLVSSPVVTPTKRR